MIYSLPKNSLSRSKGACTPILPVRNLKVVWLAICLVVFASIPSSARTKNYSLTAANTAPTTTGIASQTVTVFESFSLNVASAFDDVETPNSLTYAQSGLPSSLSLNSSTGVISGTIGYDNVVYVTVRATDPGGLWVSTQFKLTIDPDTKKELVLTAVARPNKITTAGYSIISFTPKGGVVPYQVVGVEGPGKILVFPFGSAEVSELPVGVHTFICKAKDATDKVVSAPVSITVTQANRPPVALTPIADMTVTAGQSFSINTTNLFSDPDGDSLTITVGYLPPNVTFFNNVISGRFTQPGTIKIDLFAYDRTSSALASFSVITVPASATGSGSFAITGVNLWSCQSITATERRLSFAPQYSGLTGQPVSFSVVNELRATTSVGPYSLRIYTDNPTITLKASQAGTAGEVSFSYNWLAACSNPNPPATTFAIAGVNTIDCETITASERRLTFRPQYSGQSAAPISFSVINEMQATTAAGPYTLRVYTDNPTITLVAQQATNQAQFAYNWLASCRAGQGRQAAQEIQAPLQVQLLGNPIQGDQVSFEVSGTSSQPLQLQLLTSQGRVVSQQQVVSSTVPQRFELPLNGHEGHMFLLQVSTPTQSRTLKVLKGN